MVIQSRTFDNVGHGPAEDTVVIVDTVMNVWILTDEHSGCIYNRILGVAPRLTKGHIQ